MTHNKYFFSGRLESVRKDPEGGNQPQEFVPEGVASGPHASDVLPVSEAADTHGAHSFNLNAMLLEAIRLSDYFWDLAKYKTFHEVVDQIYYNCTYATPWVPGTHKSARTTGMQSAVRGVSNAGTPGTAYTLLLKLFILRLTRGQVKALLDHADSPYIRALGLLYLRIGMTDGYKELWAWYEPYLNDREALNVDGTPATATTIGGYARKLLTDQDYHGDRLPRIPVLIQRQIDAALKEMDAGGGGGGGGGFGAVGGGGGGRRGVDGGRPDGRCRGGGGGGTG